MNVPVIQLFITSGDIGVFQSMLVDLILFLRLTDVNTSVGLAPDGLHSPRPS